MRQEVLRPVDVAVALALARQPGQGYEPLAEEIVAEDKYVWPSARGDVRGAAIPPLYDGAPELADRAPDLYRALTLVDALRVGRTRERELAQRKLEAWLEETGEAP